MTAKESKGSECLSKRTDPATVFELYHGFSDG